MPCSVSNAPGERNYSAPQNFAVNAAESQLAAELAGGAGGGPSPLGRRLELLDMAFTVVFTVGPAGLGLGMEPVMLNTIVLTADKTSPSVSRRLRGGARRSWNRL